MIKNAIVLLICQEQLLNCCVTRPQPKWETLWFKTFNKLLMRVVIILNTTVYAEIKWDHGGGGYGHFSFYSWNFGWFQTEAVKF